MPRLPRRSAVPTSPTQDEQIGKKVRDWRLKRKLGQEEIAKRVGYARATVSAIEHGKLPAHRRFFLALQREFGVDPTIFYALALLALVAIVACCDLCGGLHLLNGTEHAHDAP